MSEKFLKIVKYYGIKHQVKKFNEESYELIEAILDDYYDKDSGCKANRDHIVEEFADVCVLLNQIIQYYHLTDEEVISVMHKKVDRQLNRMEEGNGKKE